MSCWPHRTFIIACRPMLVRVLVLCLLALVSGCSPGTTRSKSQTAQARPEEREKCDRLVQRGQRFLTDGLQDDAARVLEEARRLNPASVPAGLTLARAYRLQSRFAAARTVLEEILSAEAIEEEDRRRARESLVEVLLEAGDLSSAEKSIQPLLKEKNPPATTRRLAGIVAYRNGDLPGSVSQLREAVRLAPEDAQARAALGLTLLQAGSLEEAAATLEEAVRLDPDSQAAVINLAKAYQRLGRADEAAKASQRFQKVYDSKTVRQKLRPLRAKGMQAYEAGRLDEALGSFHEVLRLAPRDPQALAQAGAVLLAMQRLDEAQASLEQSLSILPNNDFALTELARVHALRNDLPTAIGLLERAARANPTAAQPHYFLAGIYLAQGRRQDFLKEKEVYQRLQRASPGDALMPLPDGTP